MKGEIDGPTGGPECRAGECDAAAEFWVYRPPVGKWVPYCARHVREVHPSVEIRAWLESGYGKPAELGRPRGPPNDPARGREMAFRTLVDDALGWNDSPSADR